MKLILFPLLFIANIVFAVNTNISGTVNKYAPVTSIGSNSVTFGTIAPATPAFSFACGQRVLIIQMKGADITRTNTASFGDIYAINDAGNYEMATISRVSGNTIVLSETLKRTFSAADFVQIVYVPQYEDATVTAKLTALAWDGEKGGVLAIEVAGTLTLNANIDASNLGFRGGTPRAKVPTPLTVPGPGTESCGFLGATKNGVLGINYVYSNADSAYAVRKGESIVSDTSNIQYGKGPLSTGGGGGGVETGGGGGGSNYGFGGKAGGGNYNSCFCRCKRTGNHALPDYNMSEVGGLGGKSLSTQIATNKVFLGGGSGAGNNGNEKVYSTGATQLLPATGKRGGGIIMISANSIVANGDSILANGEDGYIAPTTGNISNNGGAGGGGGGSVLLNVNQYANKLIIEAKGGYGSTVVETANANRTRGAGGGGGGGLVWLSNAAKPSVVTTNVSGGAKGLSYAGPNRTAKSTHYGTDGTVGGVLYNYSVPGKSSSATNLVTTNISTSDTVNGKRQIHFAEGGFLASVNGNTNNLGKVTASVTVGSTGPFASVGCSENELYLPRVVSIVPTIQPTTSCEVSLYITGTELANFMSLTSAQSSTYKACWGEVTGTDDLSVLVAHSDGSFEELTPAINYISCSDIYQLDIMVSKFSSFYIHGNGNGAGGTLPVEWLSFDADYISKDEVELKWTTATEINNDGFYIERSYDGENFEEINFVKGKGNYNSKSEYRYIDKVDVYSNYSNVYYRLNQMDYDGKNELSKTKALKIKTYNFIGELYPNPTYSNASIDVINNASDFCNIKLFNTLGNMVYAQKVETETKGLTKLDLEIENLTPGIYTCVIEIDGERTVRRLIKR